MNYHNRLVTIITPDVPDDFPANEIPVNANTKVMSSSFISMAPEDHNLLKHSDTSSRITTFIMENIPDEIPMDAVPIEYPESHKPIIVESTAVKPSDMPMAINGHLINVPQSNMLPSITEYDDVDSIDDSCDFECCDCDSDMCDKCSHDSDISYDISEPIYPRIAQVSNNIVNNFTEPDVAESFDCIRTINNNVVDVVAERLGKVIANGMKDAFNTLMKVQSTTTKTSQADDIHITTF